MNPFDFEAFFALPLMNCGACLSSKNSDVLVSRSFARLCRLLRALWLLLVRSALPSVDPRRFDWRLPFSEWRDLLFLDSPRSGVMVFSVVYFEPGTLNLPVSS